jgi:putative inorganic carbon (HCO3(-)) transporter
LPILIVIAPLFLWAGPWSVVGLGVILALWLARRAATGRLTAPSGMDVPIALLGALALVGLAVSPDPSLSLPALCRLVLGCALFYGLVNGLTGGQAARRTILLLSIGGTALALVALVATDWSGVRFFPLPLYRLLPALPLDIGDRELFNPRIVGMALSMLIPLPLAAALFLQRGWGRLLAVGAALTMTGVWLLTQSIQAALGLVVGLLVLAAWRSRWLLVAPLLLLIVVVGGALCTLDLRQTAATLLSTDNPLGLAVVLRLDMWGRALAMLRDLPYTGIGLDAFPLVQSQFYPGLLLGPEPHAHNLYLQVALDLGLPGLTVLLWLLALAGGRVARAWRGPLRPEWRALLAGASASLAVFLASGLLDTIWTAKPVILFWIFLGIAAATCRVVLTEPPPGARAARRLLPLLFVLPLVVSLLAFPAAAAANWGLLRAHRELAAARAGDSPSQPTLRAAAQSLEWALARAPASPAVWRTLGETYGWLGDAPRGLACLEQATALDVQDPLGRYAVFEDWRRQLQGTAQPERWRDLLWVYGMWLSRFPQRGEFYVRAALVWERYADDPSQARGMLEQGLANRARPEGLLLYLLY